MRATSTTERKLSPKARDLLADRDNNLPVYVRAPKTGHERFSGFSRAKLYLLASQRHIRSVSIREPGQIRGTRLFHLGSILDFVERCEKEASKAAETESSAQE